MISRFVFIPAEIPAPRITAFALTGANAVRFELEAVPQLLYRLQHSADLVNWFTAESQTASKGDFFFTISDWADDGPRFYRVEVPLQ